MNKKLKGNLLLLLTSFIWGSAFVAQSVGMEHIGPFTFNMARNIIATLFLSLVIIFWDKKKKSDGSYQPMNDQEKKLLLLGGLACGLILFIGGSLQQVGLLYTTAGKAGFITTLYVVIVPILGLFLGKKVSTKIWICVAAAAVGLYFLSITESFTIGKGDFLIFLCAISFSFHILVIDYFSPKVDGVKMSCIQFLVVALASTLPAFLFESPAFNSIWISIKPILYAGVLSSGVAYTLQIIAQKDTDPTIASLILSLESVFAVLTGFLFLGEMLTRREFFGCAIIFMAIIVAQLPDRRKLPSNI